MGVKNEKNASGYRQSGKNGRKSLKKNTKKIEDFFSAKKKRRKELANLPIEEKVKILIQLQQIASTIYSKRGLKKTPWK